MHPPVGQPCPICSRPAPTSHRAFPKRGPSCRRHRCPRSPGRRGAAAGTTSSDHVHRLSHRAPGNISRRSSAERRTTPTHTRSRRRREWRSGRSGMPPAGRTRLGLTTLGRVPCVIGRPLDDWMVQSDLGGAHRRSTRNRRQRHYETRFCKSLIGGGTSTLRHKIVVGWVGALRCDALEICHFRRIAAKYAEAYFVSTGHPITGPHRSWKTTMGHALRNSIGRVRSHLRWPDRSDHHQLMTQIR